MIIKAKDKLYTVLEAGHWQGLAPLEATEIENPINRWTGPKRTLDQWQQVLAFFEWSYAEHKAEAMVHWFLHEEQGLWEPMVLPQRGVGMTVKILEDHERYVPTFQRLGAGWEPLGTDHHHCSGSAFQSGTDHSDEVGKEGLHLTVGGIGSGKYTLHARTSFRRQIMPTCLGDWFELPAMPEGLSAGLQDDILEEVLRRPAPEGTTFPDWWKENIIVYTRTVTFAAGQGTYHSDGYGHWQPSYTPGNKVTTYRDKDGWGNTWIESDILKLCSEFNMPLVGFAAWLKKLVKNPHLNALVKELAVSRSDLEDALEATNGLIHDQDALFEQRELGLAD